MKRKLVQSVVVAAVLTGAVAVGSLFATSAAQAALPKGHQVVLQTTKELPGSGHQGLVNVKLLGAVTGKGNLSGEFAIHSVTFAQFDGGQAIQVSLFAASCDHKKGYGQTENVVVPQNQTVHLDYPSAVHMPFVATPPASWCMYAETVPDQGTLTVTVVATKL